MERDSGWESIWNTKRAVDLFLDLNVPPQKSFCAIASLPFVLKSHC